MAALTVAQVLPSGVVTALVAAAGGGDSFPNTGDQWLDVNNGSGGSITVTIATPGKYQGQTITPIATAIPAGQRWRFGPFDPAIFNDANGNVQLTYSGVTSLTVQPVRVR